MDKKNPEVWCADLMVPVDPTAKGTECTAEGERYPFENELWNAKNQTVQLAGAANETLAFQLVVETRAGKLAGLTLDGADGVALSFGRAIAVPRNDCFVDDAVVPVSADGMADRLADIAKQAPKVNGRRRETYAVELYVPKGVAPGLRQAGLVLTQGGERRRLSLALHVYGFELPDENACTFDINNYSRVPYVGGIDADTTCPDYLEVMRRYFRLAREHRALFHLLPYGQSGALSSGYAPPLEGVGTRRRIVDWTAFDRAWGSLLDGSAFSGCRAGEYPIEYLYSPVNATWPARFEMFGKPGFWVEYKNCIRQMGEHFAEKGWARTKLEIFFNHKARWKYYPWDMDEIYDERDNDATLDFGKAALEAVRGIPGIQFINRVDSSWIFPKSARTEMKDAIGLWVVHSRFHESAPDAVKLLRDKGQDVWFYGGAGHLASTDRLENLRWPWIAWGRESNGFTWWHGLGYGSWEKPGSGGSHCLWPGERFGIAGPLATLRLKVGRRGMQDHAYLTILTEKTGNRKAADAIMADTIGCKNREDWYLRQETLQASGSEIASDSGTSKPWTLAPWRAWNEARTRIAEAIQS